MATPKRLVLGSALWGWALDQHQVFNLLDRYIARGGLWVDTAVNYPINKQKADYGKALAWLGDWLQARGSAPISVILKVGAVDNMGSPDTQLTPQHVMDEVNVWRTRLGNTLTLVAIHWDNRGSTPADRVEIRETLSAFSDLKASGLELGFSGVRHPEIYRQEAPQLAKDWWIQVKENASTEEARTKLQSFFPEAHYLAYGLNMGGIKAEAPSAQSSTALRGISPSQELVKTLTAKLEAAYKLHPAPADFNELAMRQAFFNQALSGIVVGPRTGQQLDATLDYWQALVQADTAQNGQVTNDE